MVSRVSVTLTQLRSFLAVVRAGSVTAAADALVVTQPSVSAALAALARELDAPLFHRDGRGLRLTAAGEAFAPYAADVVGLLDQGAVAVREASAAAASVLRIAAVTTAAESFVPGLMHAFAAERPGTRLTLAVGNRDQVFAGLLGHASDVAFAGRPPEDDRLTTRAFLPNRLVLICAPTDPLAGGATVAAGVLRERSWLLREPGSGTRAVNERFLEAAGLSVRTLTVGSNGAIKQAARVGLGVALLSYDAVAADVEAGLLGVIAVDPAPAPRDWHVVRSRVGPVRPVVADFLAFVTSPHARTAPA